MPRPDPHPARTARSIVFVFSVMAGWAIVAPKSSQPVVRAGEGVRLLPFEPGAVPGDDKVGAGVGDLLLESESMALTVGASTVTPERRLEYGRILDVTSATWRGDALEQFRLEARVRQRSTPFRAVNVTPGYEGSLPVVRIHHEGLGGQLLGRTVIRVRAGTPYAEIVTRVENVGRKDLASVQIGDRVAWPGAPTFVPGLGEIETPGKRRLSWFGMRGTEVSYALVYPDEEREFEFFEHAQRHKDQVAWSLPRTLKPGGVLTLRRYFVGSYLNFADAARTVFGLLRQRVGHVVGKLDPSPNAVITAVETDGTTAMRTGLEPDGSFDLPLPSGRYTLLLQTPVGHTDLLVDVDAEGPPTSAKFVVPRPGSLVFRVTDAADRPMPARIMLRGAGSTPDPVLGPDARAAGGKNEIHSATGTGEIALAPGRYHVRITRGPEYSVVDKTIVVDSGQGAVLWAVLVHEVVPDGYIACDFHLHSAPSPDSEVTLPDRIASLLAAGVEFAVATDHNHVTDFAPALRAMKRSGDLGVAVGVEVTTKDWGHFNAFPLRADDAVPPYADILPGDIFDYVRRELPDAVVQVNHPWMPGYGYFHRAALDAKTGEVGVADFSIEFDTLEIVNGFDLGRVGHPDEELRRWFDLLNLGYRHTAVGNSDSHYVSRQWAGYPRTYVRLRDRSRALAEQVAEGLRAGDAVVSAGPFVELAVNGLGPGEIVEVAEGTASVRVRVLAADWIDVDRVEIVVDGIVADVFPATPGPAGGVRVERTVELPFPTDAWVVAVARGDRALDAVLPGLGAVPFGFTNPVYVDGDGDGQYTAPASRPDEREGPPPPPRKRRVPGLPELPAPALPDAGVPLAPVPAQPEPPPAPAAGDAAMPAPPAAPREAGAPDAEPRLAPFVPLQPRREDAGAPRDQ